MYIYVIKMIKQIFHIRQNEIKRKMIGILDVINARQLYRYNQIFNEFDRCWILLCKISDLLHTIISHHQRIYKTPSGKLYSFHGVNLTKLWAKSLN